MQPWIASLRVPDLPKGAMEALYETTTGEVRSAINFLLNSPKISGGEIAAALRVDGHPINRHQVEHFRRKIQSGGYTLTETGV